MTPEPTNEEVYVEVADIIARLLEPLQKFDQTYQTQGGQSREGFRMQLIPLHDAFERNDMAAFHTIRGQITRLNRYILQDRIIPSDTSRLVRTPRPS